MNYIEIARQALLEHRSASIPSYDINDINDKSIESLEAVLKGKAVELWSDTSGRLFIVADNQDAQRLIASDCTITRGETYTAAEARRVSTIGDSAIVAEIHEWKLRFDGVVGTEKSKGKKEGQNDNN